MPLSRRFWLLLGFLALLHVALAAWFASMTPYRAPGVIGRAPAPDIGAPDERAHANYIQHLLEGRGFPSLDVSRMASDPTYRAEQYESHQPPLFYLAGAAWCKAVGVSDVSDPGAGVRIRFLNALFGAATVLGVFFAALWGFRRLDLAFAAALFPALLPMNIALSGAVSNDPLLFSLIAWTMALASRALREGWSPLLAAGVGVLTGAAILTKTTGMALLPVLVVAAWIPQAKRPSGVCYMAVLLPILLLAGPWIVRNQRIYHDPLALNVFNRAFADTAHKEQIELAPGGDGLGYWTNWVGWWTARSFIGVFGYMDIFLNETGTAKTAAGSAPNTLYRVCLGVLALLALGWAVGLGEPWVKEAAPVTIVNGTLVAVVLLLFLRFNNVFFQGQARYVYPALAPLSIGFATGIVVAFKKRPAIGVGILASGLLVLVLYAGWRLPSQFAKRLLSPDAGNGVEAGNVQ